MKDYFLKTLFLVLFFTSCSQINQSSQDQYYKKRPLRHGIVPISSNIKVSKIKNRVVDAKAVKRGRVIYKQNCFNCHGARGDGTGPLSKDLTTKPKDLVKAAKQVPNFKFYMMVSQWTGDMPGWKNVLSERDIADLENYIVHLSQK